MEIFILPDSFLILFISPAKTPKVNFGVRYPISLVADFKSLFKEVEILASSIF
jgi:hypothetical protein